MKSTPTTILNVPTLLRATTLVLLCSLVAVGCIRDGGPLPTPPRQSGDTVVTRADMRPDSASGWLYYSMRLDSIIAPEEALAGQWDVRLAYLKGGGATRTIDIVFNHGVGGVAAVQGYISSNRFENVTSVAADAPFKQEDTTAVNRIVPNCVTCPNAVFVYDPLAHVILPAADRTVVVRLQDGTVWAFQVTSIYQRGIEKPTLVTPIGYYHWRMKKLN
jgi:hypothetical protein